MTTFDRSDDLRGAQFRSVNLTGARFISSSLAGVVMRGVDVENLDIDTPWLLDGGFLRVNGVDVVGYVDEQLNRRFPGRELRRAADPEGLRAAWGALQQTWTTALNRVAAMPAGTADVSVGGEWSFAQTLRHLVMATDTWLGRAVVQREQPYHPLGQPHAGAERDGLDLSLFRTDAAPYDEVLAARADRVAMMHDFLAAVTPGQLDEPRTNPWDAESEETVRSCLHVILDEEWEHYRYAMRDLDAIEAGTTEAAPTEAAPTE